MKALLDKDQKDETALKKLIKETKDRGDEANLKRANKFDAEVSKWVSGLLGRIESGSSIFYDSIKVMITIN